MKRKGGATLAFATVAAAAFAVFSLPAGPAQAATGCLNPHCYSVQSYDQSSSQLTGVYISQHNNNMNPGGSSAAAPYHITSETWFTLGNGPDSSTNDYIETGLLDGYEFWSDGSCHCGAYAMFWADTRGDTGTQWQHTIANVSPDGTNHSYQISRGPSPNTWYIFVDGNRVGTSTALRSWIGYRMDVGGELYNPSTSQPGSFADTFDIYRQIINASGAHVNWPRESWTSITPGMNGTDYGQINNWYWNKPAT